MKVVIDNNVAIDALKPREPFDKAARDVFRLFSEGKVEPYISANSLTDIFYVLWRGKDHNAAKAKAVIQNLVGVMKVVSLTENDCMDALTLPMDDFEDAVVAVCAKKVDADCVVSRDKKFINADSGITVITPVEFLKRFT